MADDVENFAEMLNATHDGWVHANGVVFTRVNRSTVEMEMPVRPDHLQAYGLVHGGVYAALTETAASVGAAVHAIPKGQLVVGLENHTTFLKAVRGGTLRVSGRPVVNGKRSAVWDVDIRGDDGALVATGRVRLLCVEGTASIAGEKLEVRTREA